MDHYQLKIIPMKKENKISFGFRFECPRVIFVKLLEEKERKREREKNPENTRARQGDNLRYFREVKN